MHTAEGSLPWLRCEIQENRTSLCSILKLESQSCFSVLTPSLKMTNVFCCNINHVAMDFLKTSKMEMSQTYITISGWLARFLSFCWYFLLQSLQLDLQKYTKGKLFGWTQVSKRLVFTQFRGQVKHTCNYWKYGRLTFFETRVWRWELAKDPGWL